jgi:hypothetical protein
VDRSYAKSRSQKNRVTTLVSREGVDFKISNNRAFVGRSTSNLNGAELCKILISKYVKPLTPEGGVDFKKFLAILVHLWVDQLQTWWTEVMQDLDLVVTTPLTPRGEVDFKISNSCICGSINFKLGGQRLCKILISKKYVTTNLTLGVGVDFKICIERAFVGRSTSNLVDRSYAKIQISKNSNNNPLPQGVDFKISNNSCICGSINSSLMDRGYARS